MMTVSKYAAPNPLTSAASSHDWAVGNSSPSHHVNAPAARTDTTNWSECIALILKHSDGGCHPA